MRRITPLIALIFAVTSTTTAASAPEGFIIGGDRPVVVNLPDVVTTPAPLVIMLHSAGTSGAHQEKYMQLAPVAKRLGFIYIAPDGTPGEDGRRVWNAAASCCQKSGEPVDDIGYIDSLINEIDTKYPIDRSRIFFIGHSNGAFLSLSYACKTGKAAAVVSLAGALDVNSDCAPPNPFALLQIHGDADAVVKFDGGKMNQNPYTSTLQTVRRVAGANQCEISKGSPQVIKRINFEPKIPGSETFVQEFTNCIAPVVLWRIKGGSHSPKLPADYAERLMNFFNQAKPKPQPIETATPLAN